MKSASLNFFPTKNSNKIQIDIPEFYSHSLKPFQIEGIRFLHKVYQTENGAILNDDSGLGKTIQTIIFVSSILKNTSLINCLVICNEACFDHWLYHLQNWTNFPVVIQHKNKFSFDRGFYLCTPTEAIELQKIDWGIVVVDDVHSDDVIKKFKPLCKFKIWLAKDNLLDNVNFLCKILKWMTKKIDIPLKEFEYNDEELKTNLFNVWCKRQKLNIFCQKWLLRRTKTMVSNNTPLIQSKVFEENFNIWKVTTPKKVDETINSSSTPEDHKNNSDSSLILIEDNQETIEISESDESSPSLLSPQKTFAMKYSNYHNLNNFKRKGTKDITGLKFKRSKNIATDITHENPIDLDINSCEHEKSHFLEILFNDDKKNTNQKGTISK